MQSPFGFHIIKADEKSEKRTASFEEAKAYITDLLKKDHEKKAGEEFVEKTIKESGLELFVDRTAGKAEEKGSKPEKP